MDTLTKQKVDALLNECSSDKECWQYESLLDIKAYIMEQEEKIRRVKLWAKSIDESRKAMGGL